MNQPLQDRATFDHLYVRQPRRWLIVVLLAYLLVASQYARLTPDWQAPDEPAHYNYVAYLATQRALPVLRAEDYDQELIGELLASRFQADLPIEKLRYESYQPPLYYITATPVYWLSGGSLLALRLYNVMLGLITLLLLYLCAESIFPNKPLLSLGAVAFAAMLPMHVAMTAAVNNDGLADLLVVAALWLLLRWVRRQFAGDQSHARTSLLILGVVLGLGLLTKVYAYVLLPICVLVVVATLWQRTRATQGLWRALLHSLITALWVVIPALLLGLPLWLRNLQRYGGWDFLGTIRHDQVVVGQPRFWEWVNQHGWSAYGERAFSFTFRSFWGVFGWLGVFMDERIYMALMLFTGVLFLGLLWATVRLIAGGLDADLDDFQLWMLGLCGLLCLAVTASYVWYNLKFVQHQGRYFFWGLLPISIFVALAWREVMQPVQGAITGFLFGVLTVALIINRYFDGSLNKWTLLMLGLFTLILLAQPLLLAGTAENTIRWLPRRLRGWLATPLLAWLLGTLRLLTWALPFALLFALNWLIPGWFILPQLTG